MKKILMGVAALGVVAVMVGCNTTRDAATGAPTIDPVPCGDGGCSVPVVTAVQVSRVPFTPATVGAVAGEWSTDLDAAIALANANGSPMIVYVGNTRGCGYCQLAEKTVFGTVEWKAYAAEHGMPLVYLDDVRDLRYVKFITGTAGQTPVVSVLRCPTAKTWQVVGRFVYRPWDAVTAPKMIYNGIKGAYDPATFIAIVESYAGN